MPAYSSSPFASPVGLLMPGQAMYVWGGLNDHIQTTKFVVTQVAITSNVATITGAVFTGNAPLVGQLISTEGFVQIPNVTNVAIASVTLNAAGVGTITYALSHANVVAVADGGFAKVPVAETAEALTQTASVPVAIQAGIVTGGSYGITWAYTCPSAPSTIAIQLEGAIRNVAAEYTIIGTSQTTTSGYNTIVATLPSLVNFVRLNTTATTGGSSPTIIAKLLNS